MLIHFENYFVNEIFKIESKNDIPEMYGSWKLGVTVIEYQSSNNQN